MNRTITLCMITALAVVALASRTDARRVEFVEEVSHVLNVDQDVVVIITNTTGETELSGWDDNEFSIVARKTIRAQSTDDAKEYARELEIILHHEGTEKVEVEAQYPDWGGSGILDFLLSKRPSGEVDYEIQVPVRARIQIHSTTGDIYAEELGDGLTISVTSGDVRLSEIEGQVIVGATSGDIEVDDVEGDTEINVTSGEVTVIGVVGNLVVGATSGDIYCQNIEGEMDLAGNSSTISVLECLGNLSIRSSDGDVEVDGHRGGISVITSSGFVGLAIEDLDTGALEVMTSDGDVEIELDSEGSYEFIIETVSGEIDVAMPEEMDVNASRSSVQAKYRGGRTEIRISTISGDIYVEGQ